MISHLKTTIQNAGKKCYEVLVGKLNEPKLKNLQAIDLWVYVGCRETSMYGVKEFMIPVLTPHEVLMALRPTEFPWL
jgi:diphthamide biosynthesis protein 2